MGCQCHLLQTLHQKSTPQIQEAAGGRDPLWVKFGHLSGQLREPLEIWWNYVVPDVSPWFYEAESILGILVSKQTLEMQVVVPSHAFSWREHQHWGSSASWHYDPAVYLVAVLVR